MIICLYCWSYLGDFEFFLGGVFNLPLAGCSQGRSTSCTQGQTPPPAWLCTCVRARQRRRRRSRTPDRRSCRRGAQTRPPPSWVTPKPSSVPWRWGGQCPVRAELLQWDQHQAPGQSLCCCLCCCYRSQQIWLVVVSHVQDFGCQCSEKHFNFRD